MIGPNESTRDQVQPQLSMRKCDGCGVAATRSVRVTNGVLFLCQQCLDDVNRKNPDLAKAKEEVALLRDQLATFTAPSPMLFADGREPTTNERHLANLLSWREAEARQMKEDIDRLREIIRGLADCVAAQSELLTARAETKGGQTT